MPSKLCDHVILKMGTVCSHTASCLAGQLQREGGRISVGVLRILNCKTEIAGR